jgi:hypothetical protein
VLNLVDTLIEHAAPGHGHHVEDAVDLARAQQAPVEHHLAQGLALGRRLLDDGGGLFVADGGGEGGGQG